MSPDFYLGDVLEHEAAVHTFIRDATAVFTDDQAVTGRWLEAAA